MLAVCLTYVRQGAHFRGCRDWVPVCWCSFGVDRVVRGGRGAPHYEYTFGVELLKPTRFETLQQFYVIGTGGLGPRGRSVLTRGPAGFGVVSSARNLTFRGAPSHPQGGTHETLG